ncbi:FAD-binding domain-containing protein [Parasegetibacter sp. NRK P23]|uniref:FAD-binding domain-containing protein n=1 Tax=Parasegetibacter sp. NRK P23 TaxID=2942999 RepID=UPI0020438763|nr:FAD-binding domain-containing protein [Parasegetibacter sp. NRK P23]MCM5528427.1 hypothetical protein [Parasegetibacter sp. NRK P23]
MDHFPTNYTDILKILDAIDPVAYGKTRNYLSGKVTRLSPYISRGVISTKLVAEKLLARGCSFPEIEILLKELAWRDYFQQVWIALGDNIDTDIRQPQPAVRNHGMPLMITMANTGIAALDEGIKALYETGYMHNHLRMYVSSLACNIAGSHWQTPARWMYYHLLDADHASNTLSWQWVAGSFSAKKYFANQENINKYCGTMQNGTLLDVSYEELNHLSIDIPAAEDFQLPPTVLPETPGVLLNHELPTYIYNFYNLDPAWGTAEPANRILLLEPSFFERYPVSAKTMEFILELAKNIEGIKVFSGEFNALGKMGNVRGFQYKEHPTTRHYNGTVHPRDWLFPKTTGYFPSFFSFWNKCDKKEYGYSKRAGA